MLNQEEKKQCAHSLGMYVMTRVVVDPLTIQFLPCSSHIILHVLTFQLLDVQCTWNYQCML
jgi:hypothetical protein